jgi:peptidoglycan DL-endopeptidase CwlO
MSSLKTKVVSAIAFVFVLCIGLHFNSYVAKADAVANTQQGVVLKSTNLVTNKTIKVPVKEVPRSSSSSNASGTYSRGFSGGSTIASGNSSSIVNKAFEFLGKPYVYGAAGPKAFDCSGFTMYVYSAYGISLPHYTVSQSQKGLAVSKSNLEAGDLVFFNTEGFISHVGIYIGGGQFIHASSGSKRVTVSDLDSSYYNTRYVGARRLIN